MNQRRTHKQILQLASNISKFEKEPAQMNQGYSYQQKIKKIGKKPDLKQDDSGADLPWDT